MSNSVRFVNIYVTISVMSLKYIDIHSHLNLSPLLENQEAVLAKMREMGIGTITVGTGLATSREAIKISEENPGLCWATVGLHPCHTCGNDSEEYHELEMEELARHNRVVAIGETGLDYFHEDTPESRKTQEDIFRKHIQLAQKVNKPLMLHVRSSKGSDDAYYDALEILSQYRNSVRSADAIFRSEESSEKNAPMSEEEFPRANFHFFSGSKECMEKIIEAGYTISVDGPITFSRDYDDMIRACPIESLMIETDAPFAAPAPYRGKTCEPWMVGEVCKKIAEIKGIEHEAVRQQVLNNTQNFFKLH